MSAASEGLQDREKYNTSNIYTVKSWVLRQDPKGFHRRGIHDQGDFWKFLLETTEQNALNQGKFDLFIDTPFSEGA